MGFGATDEVWGPGAGIWEEYTWLADKGYYVNLLRKLDIISGAERQLGTMLLGSDQRSETTPGRRLGRFRGGKITGHLLLGSDQRSETTPEDASEIQGAERQLGTLLLGSDQRSETTPGRRLGRSGGGKTAGHDAARFRPTVGNNAGEDASGRSRGRKYN